MTNINRIYHLAKVHWQNIFLAHIANPIWNPRDQRRKRRIDVRVKSVTDYIRRYDKLIEKAVPAPVELTPEPERAFTIWLQGEDNAPRAVKTCLSTMRRHIQQELVVIDETTLFDWIALPDYIVRKWREGKISNAHFTDICRIELLYRHGGNWLDATAYVTSSIPDYIIEQNFFVFMAGQSVGCSYSYIQNCFIHARKGNPLLGLWREAVHTFWKEENSKLDYFIHHLLFKLTTEINPMAADEFAKMPKVDQAPTHRMWWDHFDDTYVPQHFEELTSDAFFQKLNYKDHRIASAKEGTVGHYMIYGS